MTGSLNPCYSIYGQSLNSDRHNEWPNQRQTSYIRYITENLSYIFVQESGLIPFSRHFNPIDPLLFMRMMN
mgnify:CR=1 FL=1